MIFSIFSRRKKAQKPTLSIPNFHTRAASAFRIADHIGNAIAQGITPGLPASEIQNALDNFLEEHDIKGYFRGYNRYPYSVSVSINDEALGGVPSDRILKNGDLAKIETGVEKDGQCAYFGWTIPVGKVSSERARLLEATQHALDGGCQSVSLQGGTLPITKAIDSSLRQSGFRPNRDFVGFRIGERPHMPPMIPGSLKTNPSNSPLDEGMNLVILVLAHSGDPKCMVRPDGFTISSRDGSDSALLSKTVTLTKEGIVFQSHPVFQYR